MIPTTKLGKLALGLILLTPTLFLVGTSLSSFLYQSVPAGNTISKDIAERPALALTMLTAMVFGISALFMGLAAIIKHNEKAILVYASVVFGALLIVFLIAELSFSH